MGQRVVEALLSHAKEHELDLTGEAALGAGDRQADLRAALTVGDLRHEVAQGRDEAQVENGGAQAVADAARGRQRVLGRGKHVGPDSRGGRRLMAVASQLPRQRDELLRDDVVQLA